MAAASRRFDAVDIVGGEEFLNQVVKSLALLKSKSPNSYREVETHIGRIQEAATSKMMSDEHPPTLYMGQQEAFPYRDANNTRAEELNLCWCASYIALEACRAQQHHAHPPRTQDELDREWCEY
jgi:hypothetical protein